MKGIILSETENTVSILTLTSQNRKTGNMAQTWHITKEHSPSLATKLGEDHHVCFSCKHRPSHSGTCYVNVGFGVNGIYRAYKRGIYSDYTSDKAMMENMIKSLLRYTFVRFGAYGEPCLLPIELVRLLAQSSRGYTGYTHLWDKHESLPYSEYFMASVDSDLERQEAVQRGWRTFRVRDYTESLLDNEINCVNTGTGIQCRECLLCSGSRKGADISVVFHGLPNKVVKFHNWKEGE